MLEMLTWLSGPEFYGSISMSEKGNSAMQLCPEGNEERGDPGKPAPGVSTGADYGMSERYSHPPLRFSIGRILMNASTAWILPS
jgi:hypothetical protein